MPKTVNAAAKLSSCVAVSTDASLVLVGLLSEECLCGVESDVPEAFVVEGAAEEFAGEGEDEGGGDYPGEAGVGLVGGAGFHVGEYSGEQNDCGEEYEADDEGGSD